MPSMPAATRRPSPEDVRDAAYPLVGAGADYDPLLAAVGDARFVVLGEASHGAHEFSRERAFVTKRLVREKGFSAVALAFDAEELSRASRHVLGAGTDADADAALAWVPPFPRWLARCRETAEFVSWLRQENEGREEPVGFHGLDVYGLYSSIAALLALLDRSDPAAAARARTRWAALDHVREEAAGGIGLSDAAEDALVRTLVDRCARRLQGLRQATHGGPDGFLWAELTPRLLREADAHYATLFRGRTAAANARGRHMASVLEALAAHLERRGRAPKVVVWAHSSQAGDSRSTDHPESAPLGRLLRERGTRDVFLAGFTTWRGTHLVADAWDAAPRLCELAPALPGSAEALFHEAGLPRFLLLTAGLGAWEPLLRRSIGVVYRAGTERLSHYLTARLPEELDAVVHLDETTPLQALDEVPRESPRSVYSS